MISLNRIVRIAAYELLSVLRDKKLLLIFFFSPLLFGILFGVAYSGKVLSNLPMVVLDQDNTPASRELVMDFDATDRFRFAATANNYPQMQEMIEDEQCMLGLIIPHNYARDLLRGKPVQVLTVYDTSNLITAYNMKKSAAQVTLEVGGQITANNLAANGFLTQEIKKTITPLSLSTESRYNPTNNYLDFLYPGLMIIIVYQMSMLAASLSFTREMEDGSRLLLAAAPCSGIEITIGKASVYIMTAIIHYAILLALACLVLGMPLKGSLGLLLVSSISAFVGAVAIGFIISALCKESLTPTRVVLVMSMPVFLASGFSWPFGSLPGWLETVMSTQPVTWAFMAARQIINRGDAPAVALHEAGAVMLLAAGAWIIFSVVYIFRKSWVGAGEIN